MRTVSGLFERLVDADALAASTRRCLAGKRRRPAVASLLFQLESELARISAELTAGAWRPSRFRLVQVHDPKPRVIAVAPVEDRLVHGALGELLLHAFEPLLSPCDHACRKGHGTHRALLRLLEHSRRVGHVLHLDVRAYFPSIDPDLALRLVARRVRDRRFLDVLERVLDAGRGLYDRAAVRRFARLPPDWPPRGRGLPIGSATSQVLAAHVFLLDLDRRVETFPGVAGYIRYVDDLFLFAARAEYLREAARRIADHLFLTRDLRLKNPHPRVRSTRSGFVGLGWRIGREGIQPLPRRLDRLQKAVRGDLAQEGGRSVPGVLESLLSGIAR